MVRRWLLALGVLALAVLVALVLAILLLPEEHEDQVAIPPLPEGAWYEVLFTTPQRTGIPPDGSPGRLDERLVALIDGATVSLDIAAYDFGLGNVADAVIRAKDRGVTVRMVTDTDNIENPALQKVIGAGVPVVGDQRRALMHNKFAVIDGRIVMTGAWNFAERDTYRHNNNSVIFHSTDLAENFTNEFEKMFVGRRFGPAKPKDVPHPVIERDGIRVETYYSAQQAIEPVLIERVRSARSSIAFLAFSFTLDDLAAALEAQRRSGVGVWGVFESTGSQTQFSEFTKLQKLTPVSAQPPFPGCVEGPSVVQDGNPFLMHHKVFVIDEQTVIFGSFNFTANAERDNDEALLIVDDPALARSFLAEFCRVYNVGVERAKERR
jgi:phosphatidylserine/phosphatidylglycerophosphate/cardiolipin synthase-like enzyme